jgi:hypothetical protein
MLTTSLYLHVDCDMENHPENDIYYKGDAEIKDVIQDDVHYHQ